MRSSLRYAVGKINKLNKVVEIGVRDGKNAEDMLSVAKEVYLVDPYATYFEGRLIAYEEQGIYKRAMMMKLAPYGDRIYIFNTESTKAANLFPDRLFDYVYIDGDHSYEAVSKDLELWYPKVRKGGVLAGHDFVKDYMGVMEGVTNFANANKLKVMSMKQDGSGIWDNIEMADWWVDKS